MAAHTIHLNDPWFGLVRDGAKRFEGRRRTPWTDGVRVGDVLEVRHFTDAAAAPFRARVAELSHFRTFEDALVALGPADVLPIHGITVDAGVEIYQRIYRRVARHAAEGRRGDVAPPSRLRAPAGVRRSPKSRESMEGGFKGGAPPLV